MSNWIRTCAAMLLVCVAMSGCGALGALAPVPEGAATEAEVDAVLVLCANGMSLVQKSELMLARAVLAKEEVAKFEDAIKAAASTDDIKEKEAKMAQTYQSLEAALAAADYEKAASTMRGDADAKKRKNVGNALYNLAWAVFNDKLLVEQVSAIVKKPPNPVIVTKLDKLRMSGQMLIEQGVLLGKIVSKGKVLVSAVGIKALPTSASDEPKEVEL